MTAKPSSDDLVVVGAYARVAVSDVAATRRRIAALEGVDVFDLDQPEKVGIVLEAASIDLAHDLLERVVRRLEGVLGVWPVSIEVSEGEPAEQPQIAEQ